MYLHLEKSIYLSFFKDTAIFLDIAKDEFKVFVGSQFSFLKELFNDEAKTLKPIFDDQNSQKISVIKNLIELGLIKKESSETPYPYRIDIKNHSKGTDNNFFSLPLEFLTGKSTYSFIETLQCFWTLIKVHRVSKKTQFQGIINLLQKEKNKRNSYIYPSKKSLARLEASLNLACLFFKKKTKCLEWSTAFVLMSLRKNWQCNLVVGVQNFPFISHAWVECKNNVIADSESLPKNLSKIICEPFRLQIQT